MSNTEVPYQPTAEEVLMALQRRAPALVELSIQDCVINHLHAENVALRGEPIGPPPLQVPSEM